MEMQREPDWKSIILRLPWLALLPVGILLPRFASAHTEAMERYAKTAYPIIKDAISSITSFLPISLAEALLYALCIGIPLLLLSRLILLLVRRISAARFCNTVLSVLIAAGIGWNLFYVTWGFNYFRVPLSERMELAVELRPAEELEQLTREIAGAAARVRARLPEDENGVFTQNAEDRKLLFSLLADCYAELAETSHVFSGKVTQAKEVEWSEGLSRLGIAGIYIGLTAEPNVNVHQPALLVYQGAAHEMAHQLGIASEDATEFAGILACLASDRPEIVYSGLMGALLRCGNALSETKPDSYRAIRAGYSTAMRRDLDAYNAYWKRYDGPAETAASAANDRYLKHNAQQSGIKSYGESVDLLLAYHATENILANIKVF